MKDMQNSFLAVGLVFKARQMVGALIWQSQQSEVCVQLRHQLNHPWLGTHKQDTH